MALTIDVRLRYRDFDLAVAQDFSLSGVTGLFGPSGSGKSTLLRIIAGLETRAVGRVAMGAEVWQEGDRLLPPYRRGVGYVFQDTRLFPHLSVRGNLDYAARRAQGLGGPALSEIVDVLDLGALLSRRPAEISGGEKQRVAIGRALLSAPEDPADGRAARRAGRGAQGRDPAVPRAAVRSVPRADHLCHPHGRARWLGWRTTWWCCVMAGCCAQARQSRCCLIPRLCRWSVRATPAP